MAHETSPLAFHGTVIHSLSPSELEILEDCLLVVAGDRKSVV